MLGADTVIVKRLPGLSEMYNPRKLHDSLVAACLSAKAPIGAAELTAKRICQDIAPWLHGKPEVTSLDVRHRAHAYLAVYNPAAARKYAPKRRIMDIRKFAWLRPATITT